MPRFGKTEAETGLKVVRDSSGDQPRPDANGVTETKGCQAMADEQMEIEGFEEVKLSAKVKRLLKIDFEYSEAAKLAKKDEAAAREKLTEVVLAEGLSGVRCPFRGKRLIMGVNHTMKWEKILEPTAVDRGAN
jgi:hypothetical protein